MTPLARRVVAELTLPVRKRTFHDFGAGRFLNRMSDVHCFECTQVMNAATALALQIADQIADGHYSQLTFLPAPRTWIEWKDKNGRVGFLLEELQQNASAKVWLVEETTFSAAQIADIDLIDQLRERKRGDGVYERYFDQPGSLPFSTYADRIVNVSVGLLHALLALINTPRIIGRRTHAPHRGLERELLRQQKIIGKFPLRAWTEIKLEVAASKDCSKEGPIEEHLTGARALHFVRAHLRVRLGKLEIVRSHWRGDAALGIRQSRYVLVQGQQ